MTLLNPREVAEILGISERTVHQLCREGKLGYCQVDAKHRRFTQEHVEAYVGSVSVSVSSSTKKSVPAMAVSPKPQPRNEIPTADERAALRKEMKAW
jgi:excisionase family DNA binding protein